MNETGVTDKDATPGVRPYVFRGLLPDAMLLETVMARSVVAPWTTLVNGAHCRVWMGGVTYGYGMFRANSRTVPAHAVVLAAHLGAVGLTAGSHTCHQCRETKLCVEPLHLALGDASRNALESFATGRPGAGGTRRNGKEMRRLGLFPCGCAIAPANTIRDGGTAACRHHSRARHRDLGARLAAASIAYQHMTAALTGTFDLLPKKRREQARAEATKPVVESPHE